MLRHNPKRIPIIPTCCKLHLCFIRIRFLSIISFLPIHWYYRNITNNPISLNLAIINFYLNIVRVYIR